MIIIGITGTLGAGKGTIVGYLADKKGFFHFSVRDFLSKEITRRGMPRNRDSMFLIGNELRAEHGPSFVVDNLYSEAVRSGGNSVIESIRTTGEIASLRRKGMFYLFAADADPHLRYGRILARGSETDSVSFETFLENERRESVSADPGVQNLQACIREADFRFLNNGSKEDLFKEVDSALSLIL